MGDAMTACRRPCPMCGASGRTSDPDGLTYCRGCGFVCTTEHMPDVRKGLSESEALALVTEHHHALVDIRMRGETGSMRQQTAQDALMRALTGRNP
jgi:hypothetical protein